MREKLVELLTRKEDEIIHRLIDYAKTGGFTRYSSTRRGDWRLSVHEIIQALSYYLKNYKGNQIHAEEKLGEDSVTSFGIESAKLHRARGITLKMFLGLFKYYRRSYLDILKEGNLTSLEQTQAAEMLNTFFDLFEIGFCSEWVGEGPESRLTELQAINRRLTNEKNKFKTIFESMTECVFVVDYDMKIIEINPAAAAFFDVSPEAVIGIKCSQLMGCDLKPERCHLYQAMKTGGSFKDIQMEIKTKQGQRRILTSGSFLHDISGKYAGGVQVFVDITERSIMEQSLRLHMHANNSSIESVSIFDVGGNLIYANPAAINIFALEYQQLLGMGIEEVYPGGEKVLLSLVRGESWKGEMHHGGKILNVHANPIRLPQGNIIGFYVAAKDITSIKATQLKLQQAKEETEREAAKLRAIISIMNASIALADADGVITEVNEQCLMMSGLTRDQVIGKTLDKIHSGKIFKKVWEIIERYSRYEQHAPTTITRRLGEKDVIMNIQPVYRDKTYDGVLLMVVDISEVVKAKRQAEQALLEAEKANLAKSEFLANMSHEIRTPMNGILGFAEVLMQQELNTKQQESIKIIQQCGEQLMDLINDILDLSKIESGKLTIEERVFSLRKIIHEAVNVIESRLQARNIEIKINIEQNLHDHFKGDATRIRQVLYNLISNAAKFTHRGYIKISVGADVLDAFGQQMNLFFSVEDTGIGIPKEKLKLIFEAFTQADGSTTRKYGGTGLGLTICKSLTRLMGGELSVKSEVNKGSVFSFNIPVDKVEIIEQDKSQEARSVEIKNGTVLVVEDDCTTRQLIKNYLERAGYAVISTEQGKEAITLAKIYQPNVILLDILLPDLTGWEVLQRIKTSEDTREIPIVICSVMPEKERAFSLGAVDFIEKPISEGVLIDRLEKVITRQRNDKINILLIDDEEATLQYLKGVISQYGYKTHSFTRAEDALAYLFQGGMAQAIILDLLMPGMDGFEFLANLRMRLDFRKIPVLINTGKDLTPEDYQRLNDMYEKILNKSVVQPNMLLVELNELLNGVTSYNKKNEKKKSANILLVEDNYFNQYLVEHLLADEFKLTVVENGLRALEALAQEKFDLILMDMQMPVMDGYETTGLIRRQDQFKELPIIALTAHAMKGDYEKCIAAGCNAYLAKPVKRDDLIKTIKQYLALAGEAGKKGRIRDKGIEALIPWYLQDLGEEMKRLKQAAETNDFTTMRYIGHGLKGSGGAYGFPEFSISGAAIEKAAINEDGILLKELVEQLQEVYKGVLEENF